MEQGDAQNINSEENNYQEKPLSTDENMINENIIKNKNLNDPLNQDIDDLTNSDIDDPKYLPKENYPLNDNIQNQIIDTNIDINNYIPNNENQKLLYSQLNNLENEKNMLDQNIEQIENENNQLESQIMEYQDKFNKKEGINNQFKLLPTAFNQRFAEYDKRNKLLQKNINELENLLKNKEVELAQSLKDKSKSEIAIKNAGIYKQYMEELQNEFKEKINKLNQKYIEKESSLKSEYVDEINRKMQKVEELKIENDKLKYDLSNVKMNKEALNHQLEEKDYNSNTNINQKEKEIMYLKEKITEFEKKIEQKKNILQVNLNEYESQLNEVKQENNELLNQVNDLRNQKKENDIKLNNYKHNIQMLNNELNQNNNSINNKTSLLEQLGFEIDEKQKTSEQMDIDLQNFDIDKENQINDYNNQIEEITNEKNFIEAQNEEFKEYLSKAIENLKQLNEQFVAKYGALEEELGLQMNENEMIQKKYKDILKKAKKKQSNLNKKNEELKMKVYNPEINFGVNNQLNKTMVLMQPPNLKGDSLFFDNNNIINQKDNISNFENNNFGLFNNDFNNIEDINDNEMKQNQTLNDFKQLLRKMDEKLNSPF